VSCSCSSGSRIISKVNRHNLIYRVLPSLQVAELMKLFKDIGQGITCETLNQPIGDDECNFALSYFYLKYVTLESVQYNSRSALITLRNTVQRRLIEFNISKDHIHEAPSVRCQRYIQTEN